MKKISAFFALFLMICSVNAFAQFEGKITYHMYEIENGQHAEEEQMTAYFTPSRILLQTTKKYSLAGSVEAEGLLIRLKQKDFVFLTGQRSAMAITKAEITSFINMFSSWSQEDTEQLEKRFTFKKTDQTKTINGYEVQKFIYQNKDDQSKVVVWMTRELNINWGMLAEPWGDTISFITSKDLPMHLVFQEGWLPIKTTSYEDGKATAGFTATVKKTDLSNEMVHLSENVNVKSMAEYLFSMMRKKK